jgi:hypothetical protein
MWSSRTFDSDDCPVADELLGSLYRDSEHGLPALVDSVSSDVRALLALFCYRRAHLHSLSLAIAATCTEHDLVTQGGMVGSTLYAQSREAPRATTARRRGITLPTATPGDFVPAVDDDEDEPAATAGEAL